MESEDEWSLNLNLEVLAVRFLPDKPPTPVTNRQPPRLTDLKTIDLPSLMNKERGGRTDVFVLKLR